MEIISLLRIQHKVNFGSCRTLTLRNLSCTVEALCDQCMVGLVDPVGKPTKKATIFLASAECLVRRLRLTCNRMHQHEPLAGQINGIARCKFAQVWPRRLVELLAEGVCECLKTRNTAYPVAQDPYGGNAAQTCAGCRAHARKDDPRHTRVAGCRFPNADTYTGIVQHANNINCQRTLAIPGMLTVSGQLHLSVVQVLTVYQISFVNLRLNLMFCLLLQMSLN